MNCDKVNVNVMTLEAKLVRANNRNIKRGGFLNTAAVIFDSLPQTLGKIRVEVDIGLLIFISKSYSLNLSVQLRWVNIRGCQVIGFERLSL